MGFSSRILITRRGSSGVIRLELTQTIVPSSIRTQARASSWSLPRPFLRLELVQRRPYGGRADPFGAAVQDRKSTRLNSSHGYISYAVFCLKKKKKKTHLAILDQTVLLTKPHQRPAVRRV